MLVLAAGAGWAWWQGHLAGIPIREVCTATADGSRTTLDPEQAGNAATIAGVAVQRGLPARAATIGIATALQESKLHTIDHGDRDSRGLFQQRPSQGWGTAEQVMDPVYAANAFYDVLVTIEGYQSAVITDVAQQVQRSAFPSAYARHEPQARILALVLSGYSAAAFDCTLRPVAGAAAQPPGPGGFTPRAAAVAAAAQREAGRTPSGALAGGTGVRYVLGGGDGQRVAWSLAQWAVGRAGQLDVVTVRTDGRQWQRSEPGEGWTPLEGRAAARVPAGTVEILVAAGS